MIIDLATPANLPKDKPLLDYYRRGTPQQAEAEYPAGTIYTYHQKTGGVIIFIDPRTPTPPQPAHAPAHKPLSQDDSRTDPPAPVLQIDSDQSDPEPAPACEDPEPTPQSKKSLSDVIGNLTFNF